jgi:hypothetical protein
MLNPENFVFSITTRITFCQKRRLRPDHTRRAVSVNISTAPKASDALIAEAA